MPRKRKQNPLPVTVKMEKLEQNVRGFLVGTKNVTRGLEGLVRKEPKLALELKELNGLQKALTEDFSVETEREYAPRFLTLQNSMYLDHYFDGDISKCPTVREQSQELGSIHKITTKIATELSDCCEEIKRKLDDLEKSVTKGFSSNKNRLQGYVRYIRDSLQRAFRNLYRFLIRKFNSLNNLIISKFTALTDFLITKFEFLESILENLNRSFTEEITGLFNRIQGEFSSLKSLLERLVSSLEANIKSHITREIGSLKSDLDQKLTLLLEKQDSLERLIITNHSQLQTQIQTEFEIQKLEFGVISRGIGGLLVEIATLQGEMVAGFATVSGGFVEVNALVVRETGSVITQVKTGVREIDNRIDKSSHDLQVKYDEGVKQLEKSISTSEKTLEKDIETETQTLEEFFKEEIKLLPETVAKEVSLWIVGEAYKKWDSVTSYFPSLTFIFVEDTESNEPRRCQIKVRLKKPGTDLTEADIEKLRVLTLAHGNMGYTWGRVRGNYVSGDKRFKTTIYGSSENEIVNILSKICSITEDRVERNLFTFTSGGTLRPSHTRRTIGLDGKSLNDSNYKENFYLKLKRVVLLVNGLQQPIIINIYQAIQIIYQAIQIEKLILVFATNNI
uniref:Uncharacterized protein n=1 Tax=Parietochloris pseudoalveolaris TaxID=3102 RepID=A0A097KLN2_9CHLO|nr:hypothetical protein [Parietochloris pseudoalveolaris]AIT94094.1 hypothetical protein [Parietochloris pseudoalveolaris]